MSEDAPEIAADETRAMEPRLAIDAGALDRYLAAALPGYRGPLTIRQFTGGQSNPTYLLRTPAARYVLRRKPPGELLPSAHAVDREFRVMTALGAAGLPVPRTLVLCEEAGVIGTMFYLMAFAEGRHYWDPALPGIAPAERAALYDAMNAALADLHRVDPAAVGLGDFGRPGNYFARQIARWSKQYKSSETEPIAAMERLIAWLPEHVPAGEETAVVHGDYRLDNLIFHPTEPRVLAILDWELSTLGHPLADIAYNCMAWRFPPALFRGIGGLDLAGLGIPSEADYLAAYCRRTGRGALPHWPFYMAYSMFRIAAILQGVYARSLAGNAADARSREMGAKVAPIAEIAWAEAERAGS
jgi:aminoglycoside phosphotransferase (APT) family kinase protein